jgi:hypothetical protein
VKVGGKRFVSEDSLQRFIDEVTAATALDADRPSPRSTRSESSKASQAAAEYCQAEGL